MRLKSSLYVLLLVNLLLFSSCSSISKVKSIYSLGVEKNEGEKNYSGQPPFTNQEYNLEDRETIIVQGIEGQIEGLTKQRILRNLGLTIYIVSDSEKAEQELALKGLKIFKDQLMTAQMLSTQELMGISPDNSFEKGSHTVCIMDSGININHLMFDQEQLLDWKDFVGADYDSYGDLYDEPCDYSGHGTAMASIIAGKQTEGLEYQWIERNDNEKLFKQFDGLKLLEDESATFTIYNMTNALATVSFIELYRNGSITKHVLATDLIFSGEEQNIIYTSPNNISFFGMFNVSLTKILSEEPLTINSTVTSDSYSPYHGIVPGTNMVILKVLDDEGIGTTSTFLDACDYLLGIKEEYNVTTVNLSFAWDVYVSEVTDAVNELCENGLCVIAAAGNNGPNIQIVSPGLSRKAITVGAYNAYHQLTTYSCRLDLWIKPEVLAPGGSYYIDTDEGIIANPQITCANSSLNDSLTSGVGTSFSAALISGVALALTNNYNWEWDWYNVVRIKNQIIMNTVEFVDYEYLPDINWYGIPERTYNLPDGSEGYGDFYYSEPEEISFRPFIEERTDFDCDISLDNQLTKVYKFKTYEEFHYTLNWTATNSIHVWAFFEDPCYNVIYLEDEETTRNGGQHGAIEDIFPEGNGKNVFIIVRYLEDDTHVNLTLSTYMVYEPIFVIREPSIYEPTRVSSNMNIDVDFRNGYFSITMDGQSIEQYKSTPGYYYIPEIEDGKHTLIFNFTTEPWYECEYVVYTWKNDVYPPTINCSESNNEIFSEQSTIYFTCEDGNNIKKFVLEVDEQTYFETEPNNPEYIYEFMLDPVDYEEKESIQISVEVTDEFNRTTTLERMFNLHHETSTTTTDTTSTTTTDTTNSTQTTDNGGGNLGMIIGISVTSAILVIFTVSMVIRIRKKK